MSRLGRLVTVLVLLCALGGPVEAGARGWAPPPLPPERFAISEAPQDVKDVVAADGTPIRVETWLPQGEGAPSRVPVVAEISPYHAPGNRHGFAARFAELFVKRGYAYAQVHVRGTGASGGCYAVLTGQEADDAALAIHYLGEQASFGDGTVGLFGKSNAGGQQLNVASRGRPELLRSLKAIVPVSPVITHYDFRGFDGMPILSSELLTFQVDFTASYGQQAAGYTPTPQQAAERAPCMADYLANATNPSGVPTDWDQERELRRWAKDVRVPTLFTMGTYETQTRQLVGYFDQLDAPKVGLFGHWRHDHPSGNAHVPEWSRTDWDAMLIAWFDHWLRGADNGAAAWPTQVQDSLGRWRAEPDYPLTGGPAGQLVLSADGSLGSVGPTGESVLDSRQSAPRAAGLDGQVLSFRTPALEAPLRITGVPVLDAWVTLDRPAGYLVADLRVIDAAGEYVPRTRRVGARSLRHLDPLVDNRFAQTVPKDPPVGVPIRVPVRFETGDLAAPAGSRLELRLSAAGSGENGETYEQEDPVSGPPADGGEIRVSHACKHPSVLRFLMPRQAPDLLEVAGSPDPAPATGSSPLPGYTVCGRPPERLDLFGPAAPQAAWALSGRATRRGPRIRVRVDAGEDAVAREVRVAVRRRGATVRRRALGDVIGTRTVRLRARRCRRCTVVLRAAGLPSTRLRLAR